MTTLSDPGSTRPVTEAVVATILEQVVDALLEAPNAYQVAAGRPRYFWPQDDQIVTYVADLPEDCTPIEAAIRQYMAYVGSDNHIRFPVKEIEFDRVSGCIRVIGDPDRITEMRTLPRR